MEDLFHGSIIALAEFLIELELIHADAEFGTVGEIDAFSMENSLAVKVESAGWIAGIEVSGGQRRGKRQTRCERNLQRGSPDRGVVSAVAEGRQRAGDRLL